MTKRRDSDLVIGITAIAVALAIITFGLTGGINRLLSGASTHTVRAALVDGQQLKPGDQVRVQGIVAGEIEKIESGPGGRGALVTMAVRDDAGPLYADAGAVVRWQTVLGGKFYVDLERGSAARGKLRDTIPMARTARQVELDDIAGVVQGDARKGLQTLPGEVADALADPKPPARVLDKLADISPAARRGLGALRGEDLDRDLRGLIAETSRTVSALDAPRDELRTLVSGAAATLSTTAKRADDVRALLRGAPATEREVSLTTDRLRGTLALANPLLDDLQKPATRVEPTFHSLRPVVADADALVQRAVPLLQALRPAATSLAGTARRGLPLVKALEPSLERLDKTILPYLAEKDSGTGKSTAVMIGGTFTGLASGAGGQMDANGHFIRFPATVGSSPASSLPCQTYISNPDAAQIIACQTLQEAVSTYFGYKPLSDTPGTEPAKRSKR